MLGEVGLKTRNQKAISKEEKASILWIFASEHVLIYRYARQNLSIANKKTTAFRLKKGHVLDRKYKSIAARIEYSYWIYYTQGVAPRRVDRLRLVC